MPSFVPTVQRQLDLFPSAQSAWQLALAALERFEINSARAQIASAAQASDERTSFREMAAAVDWLEAMGLSETSGVEALCAALWDTPEWERAGELAPGAAGKVLDALARRIVACSRGAELNCAARARAHLLLGAFDAARRALDGVSASARFDARTWAARADVWAQEGHPDARVCYGRALALDPRAVEPRWFVDVALRERFEQLCRASGFERAREQVLAEAWLARELELPEDEPEFGLEVRRRRVELESRDDAKTPNERLFALLLAEDLACGADIERRERMQALDAGLFARVLERRRQDQAQRRI